MQNIGDCRLCALCRPLGYLPLIPVGSRGLAERETQPVPRPGGEESGMSNIQLNFTFNRRRTSLCTLPLLAHVLSLQTRLSWFPYQYLLWTRPSDSDICFTNQLAPSLRAPLSSLREEVCDPWDDPSESARGECDLDIFAKCHECHDSWLGHFHTKSSPILNTALPQLITSAMPWPFLLQPEFLFHEMVASKESLMCQSF